MNIEIKIFSELYGKHIIVYQNDYLKDIEITRITETLLPDKQITKESTTIKMKEAEARQLMLALQKIMY